MPSLEVRQTAEFADWLRGLNDQRGKAAVLSRIDRLAYGIWGDVAPVSGGVSELRVHVGPGYRVYLTQRGREIVVLLCGGDKDSQQRDIRRARRMAEDLEG